MGWFTDMMFGGQGGESYEQRLAREAEEARMAASPQPAPVLSEQEVAIDAKTAGIASAPPDPYRAANGHKIIPVVSIERVESHLSNDMKHVEIWATAKNHSDFEIELTRVNLWRQHSSPGRFLKPGEGYEIRMYAGETRTDDAEHKAEVQYKIVQTGDYFQADYRIDYRSEHEGDNDFYIPEEMKLIEPVRDI